MSTILAVQKNGYVALAWDAMRSVGSTRSVGVAGPHKVVRIDNGAVGCTGFSVYYNALAHYLRARDAPVFAGTDAVFEFFLQFWRHLREHCHFVNDQSDSDAPSPFADLGAEFLVVSPSGIFLVKEILSVCQFERFCAIGSGAPQAEGALSVLFDQDRSALEIAKGAMDVALRFDAASGGPIQTLELQCDPCADGSS